MTITADIYELAVVIIALAFLILVIAAIPTLLQLKRTVRAFEELSTESRKTVELVNTVIKKAGEVGLKATGLADLVLDGIKSPLITVLSMLVGLECALKFLVNKDKDKPNKTGGDENV